MYIPGNGYFCVTKNIHNCCKLNTNRRLEAKTEQRVDHNTKGLVHFVKWRSVVDNIYTNSLALMDQILKQFPVRILRVDHSRCIAK